MSMFRPMRMLEWLGDVTITYYTESITSAQLPRLRLKGSALSKTNVEMKGEGHCQESRDSNEGDIVGPNGPLTGRNGKVSAKAAEKATKGDDHDEDKNSSRHRQHSRPLYFIRACNNSKNIQNHNHNERNESWRYNLIPS